MVDEWGAWYNEVPNMGALYQQSSQRDAVLAMMSFNIFNNHCRRVKMALAAQAVNVLFASMLTQNPPTTAMVKTPTYYVFKMLKPHQNATMIPVNLTCGNVNNIPILSASASIDSSKNIHISLGNHHATSQQTLTITLSGSTTSLYTKVSGQIVNGPSYTSYNDFNKSETVTLQDFPSSNYSLSGTKLSVTLPAHSAVMLSLPAPVSVGYKSVALKMHGVTIKAKTGGSIIIKGATLQKTPVRLALFTMDGRMIASMSTVNKTGSDRIEWQPAIHSTGIYVIKAQIEGVSESQKIALTR